MKSFRCKLIACVLAAGSMANIGVAGEASMEMHHAMQAMCEKMDGMQMSNDANQDFVKMMIPHHQSAVDMATAYLKEGKDPQLVEMARKIIEAQKKEIEELQTWLEAHGSAAQHP